VVYVCGDAKGMAPGVHETLIDIADEYSSVGGENVINQLEQEGRYKRDVY